MDTAVVCTLIHLVLSCAGNKVWYTTMGAKDIIGHAISASAGSLPSKIKVGTLRTYSFCIGCNDSLAYARNAAYI